MAGESISLPRRRYLEAIMAGTAIGPAISRASTASGDLRSEVASRPKFPELMFDSTCSLLNQDGNPLTDESTVAVWAEPSARITDSDEDGNAVNYGDERIPLVAIDGAVAGIGAPIFENETEFAYGNDEFGLNLLDATLGSGKILWDEGHGQYYTLSKFTTFATFAENNGYSFVATSSLTQNLTDADGVVITTPSSPFSDDEQRALADFVDNGGVVFLVSQSDYQDYDATGTLNEIAATLGVDFRFNDAQVVDDKHNTGPNFVPVTDEFNTQNFGELFRTRKGIGAGPKFSFEKRYSATVSTVYDGDTFVAKFDDGSTEEVRVLGVDTPETPDNAKYELPHEWEGIGGAEIDGNYPYLSTWGTRATEFAKETLLGGEIELSFDRNEGLRDPFGRLLAYVHQDDGTSYSSQLIENGYARVFDSGLRRHDELLKTELAARSRGVGLWEKSNPDRSSTIRNDPVRELYFPNPAPVTTADQSVSSNHVPVFAESSASVPGAPLVAVDAEARLAIVGAPFVDESYEKPLGFPVSTAEYDNFAFFTNLIAALSDRSGAVFVDGGHGQFASQNALSAEDVAFYQRYLEGVDIGLEGINDFDSGLLDRGRALVITAPPDSLDEEAIAAIESFRDDGGAVILMGSGAASSTAQINLNSIARALNSDLRIELSHVTDPKSNVSASPSVLATSNLNEAFGLFEPYEAGRPSLTTGGTTTTATEPKSTQTDTANRTRTGTVTTATGSSGSTPGLGIISGVSGIVGGGLALRRLRDGDG